MSWISFAVGLTLFLSTATVSHAGFNYDEGSSGDLDAFDSLATFDLEIGDNVISGSTSVEWDTTSLVFDWDAFAFTLPGGSQLESVLFSYQFNARTDGWVILYDVPSIAVFAEDGSWAGEESQVGSDLLPIFSDGSVPDVVPPSPVAVSLYDQRTPNENGFPYLTTLPLNSGLYVFYMGIAASGLPPVSAAWDYSLEFTVEPVPVPEPVTAVLVGIGLAVLGCGRTQRSL